MAALKQESLIECAELLQRASRMIDTPLKTWNSLSVWDSPIAGMSLAKLKSELKRIGRLKDLLGEEEEEEEEEE